MRVTAHQHRVCSTVCRVKQLEQRGIVLTVLRSTRGACASSKGPLWPLQTKSWVRPMKGEDYAGRLECSCAGHHPFDALMECYLCEMGGALSLIWKLR